MLSVDERDSQIACVIKSNLLTFGLTPEQIEIITHEMTQDILDVLNNYEGEEFYVD